MARSKKKKFSIFETVGVSFVTCLFGVVIGLIGSIGYSLSNVKNDEKEKNTLKGNVYSDFQIHFLELGNIYAGDLTDMREENSFFELDDEPYSSTFVRRELFKKLGKKL